MVPYERGPGVGRELEVLHTGERALVRHHGRVGLEEVEERPGHLADDGSRPEVHIGHADGRNAELPVYVHLRHEEAYGGIVRIYGA